MPPKQSRERGYEGLSDRRVEVGVHEGHDHEGNERGLGSVDLLRDHGRNGSDEEVGGKLRRLVWLAVPICDE